MGLEDIRDRMKAEAVLTVYAEGISRFNAEKGRRLGLDPAQIDAVRSALGYKPLDGFITGTERENLRKAGFSESFVATLAGDDGKEALRRRALWLSENAASRWYRPSADRQDRAGFLEELKVIGGVGVFSEDVLANVVQAAQDDEARVRNAAYDILAMTDTPTQEVIEALDRGRLSDSPQEAWSATDALLQLAERLRLADKKLPKELRESLRSIWASAHDANHRFQAVGLLELKMKERVFAGVTLRAYAENPKNFTRQSFLKLGMTESQVDDLERVLGPSGSPNWNVEVVEGEKALESPEPQIGYLF